MRPRADYSVVHGELSFGHVLVTDDGLPVLIDIEDLMYFDVEWEHVFLRTGPAGAEYPALAVAGLDEDRIAFSLLTQRLSLVAGPLRLLEGDFPGREQPGGSDDFAPEAFRRSRITGSAPGHQARLQRGSPAPRLGSGAGSRLRQRNDRCRADDPAVRLHRDCRPSDPTGRPSMIVAASSAASRRVPTVHMAALQVLPKLRTH